MALKYTTICTNKPGTGKEGEKIYFPKLTGSTLADIDRVAELLEKQSSASKADVYLIIMGLVNLIPELLLKGYTIKLDKLGSFRLHAKVTTADSPEKISRKNIKEIRISFIPDRKIKQLLQQAVVSPMKR